MPENETITITQEQLDNIVKGAIEKALETRTPPEKKEEEKKENIVDDAKKRLESERKAKEENNELETAIKFNMNIDKFISDNEKILPEESKKIIEEINTKNFSGEKEKADNTRKAIIDSFIQIEDNIKILPASQKELVEKYKKLTEDEKVKQSTKFWGIVDVGIGNKILMRKAEQQRGGSESAPDEFEKRWLAQGEKLRKGK